MLAALLPESEGRPYKAAVIPRAIVVAAVQVAARGYRATSDPRRARLPSMGAATLTRCCRRSGTCPSASSSAPRPSSACAAGRPAARSNEPSTAATHVFPPPCRTTAAVSRVASRATRRSSATRELTAGLSGNTSLHDAGAGERSFNTLASAFSVGDVAGRTTSGGGFACRVHHRSTGIVMASSTIASQTSRSCFEASGKSACNASATNRWAMAEPIGVRPKSLAIRVDSSESVNARWLSFCSSSCSFLLSIPVRGSSMTPRSVPGFPVERSPRGAIGLYRGLLTDCGCESGPRGGMPEAGVTGCRGISMMPTGMLVSRNR